MSNYKVSSAWYSGSIPASATGHDNPKVWISASVDGIDASCLVFWDLIQRANVAGGQTDVRSALAPVLYHAAYGPGSAGPGVPIFNVPDSDILAPVTGTQNQAVPGSDNPVTCSAALVGSWTV